MSRYTKAELEEENEQLRSRLEEVHDSVSEALGYGVEDVDGADDSDSDEIEDGEEQ